MSETLRKELEECLNDPMFDYINEESVKKFSEVVRDVYPHATHEEICKRLELWEREDMPETFYQKLLAAK